MPRNPLLDGALKVVRKVALRALDRGLRPRDGDKRGSPRRSPRPVRRNDTATPSRYPGDFTGSPAIAYQPNPDGRPDPGEVVWTWVPYEDDPREGKDRPVLLIGRDGPWLLGLQVTSRDHDVDSAQEASEGRYWMDIGSGAWDERRRPSEVRVNRIIRIDPDAVRRVGAVLDRRIFDGVAREVHRHR